MDSLSCLNFLVLLPVSFELFVDASYRLYRGHARVVSNVKFAAGGSHLISIGAVDKAIFQWKFNKDKVKAIPNYDLLIDKPLKLDVRIKPHLPKEEQKDLSKTILGEREVKRKKLTSDVMHSRPKDFKMSRRAVRVN